MKPVLSRIFCLFLLLCLMVPAALAGREISGNCYFELVRRSDDKFIKKLGTTANLSQVDQNNYITIVVSMKNNTGRTVYGPDVYAEITQNGEKTTYDWYNEDENLNAGQTRLYYISEDSMEDLYTAGSFKVEYLFQYEEAFSNTLKFTGTATASKRKVTPTPKVTARPAATPKPTVNKVGNYEQTFSSDSMYISSGERSYFVYQTNNAYLLENTEKKTVFHVEFENDNTLDYFVITGNDDSTDFYYDSNLNFKHSTNNQKYTRKDNGQGIYLFDENGELVLAKVGSSYLLADHGKNVVGSVTLDESGKLSMLAYNYYKGAKMDILIMDSKGVLQDVETCDNPYTAPGALPTLSTFYTGESSGSTSSGSTGNSWTCTSCKTSGLTGNFCPNCGQPRPSTDWVCPVCDKTRSTPFCPDDGTKRP